MSFAWGIFMLFHINFTVMIHTVSIFLTLALATWRLIRFIVIHRMISIITIIVILRVLTIIIIVRLIMIKLHSLATQVCTMQRCRKLLFLAFGNNFVVFPPFNHSCCELMMKHHMNDHLCASVLLLLQ